MGGALNSLPQCVGLLRAVWCCFPSGRIFSEATSQTLSLSLNEVYHPAPTVTHSDLYHSAHAAYVCHIIAPVHMQVCEEMNSSRWYPCTDKSRLMPEPRCQTYSRHDQKSFMGEVALFSL